MSDETDRIALELAALGARLEERIDGMRTAVKDSEERIRSDVDRMDKRINGRLVRVETELWSEKVVLARAQGAAEERERHGLPPDPLPPPVPNGQPQVEQPAATVPRWVQVVAGLSAAIAALLGGFATLAPLVEAMTK